MQQFVVPQFIDVEDKIIGPITTRQFLILLAGGLLIFIAYKLSDFVLFVVEGVIIFALSGTLAFLRINGQPFHFFILNLLQTLKRPYLQIWNKELTNEELKLEMGKVVTKPMEAQTAVGIKKLVGTSRLSELSLIVDTGGVYHGEE